MEDRLKYIFCVDDDEDILAVAKLCLECVGGFEVTCMPKSTDAIHTARKVHPDLILVDVMMPIMDGPAVLKKLREDDALCDIPVAFMTARVQNEEVREYLNLGAAGVIAKPFDALTLCDQVREIWRQHHMAA
jgi:two-component system, OmpR family, response regulator